jgi:hypothetical protein
MVLAGGGEVGGPVLGAPDPTLGEFVEHLRRAFLPLRGEHPHEVTVADVQIVQSLRRDRLPSKTSSTASTSSARPWGRNGSAFTTMLISLLVAGQLIQW